MLINNLADTISLAGEWQFQPGFDSPWSTIQVPGCWEAQGYSKFFEGPATYRRTIFIPETWAGVEPDRPKTIQLEFEAVSYACTMWLNGTRIGAHQGLWTPFAFDVTQIIQPGQENTLEIQVYKPGKLYPMRSSLAGFIPDIATTFGGLWQAARLQVFEAALDDLRVDANVETGSLQAICRVHGDYENPGSPSSAMEWSVEIFLGEACIISQRQAFRQGECLDTSLVIPDRVLWTPENPVLYSVQVSLTNNDRVVAQVSRRTGFRRLSTRGNQVLLNGKPFQVRGILSWGWEPDRIAPAYTFDQAREEMRRIRAHGFNLIKLCLFVPNQAYFEAADAEGMLLWQEWPMWLPQVTSEMQAQARQEYLEYMKLTRDHPSVVLYSLGCELNRSVGGEFLRDLDRTVRASVADVLICDNSGSGESYGGLEIDFADFTDYHPYNDIHFFEPLLDNWRRDWQPARPWIFGEFCDSDTFRDTAQIIQANRGQRPWWLTKDNPVTTWRPESIAMLEAEQRLAQANLPFSSEEIRRISLAQTQVIRKYTLESLRKRTGIGGYIVTGLRDTPISTSGIWDDFNQAKWPADEFRLVNNDAVLALEVGRRRKWRYGGDRPDKLDVHNFWSGDSAQWHVILHLIGEGLPAGSQMDWQLVNEKGEIVEAGSTNTSITISPGNPGELGAIACTLPVVDRAAMFFLRARIEIGNESIANHWPVWVYPPLHPPATELRIYDPSQLLEDADAPDGAWLGNVPRVSFTAGDNSDSILLATAWGPWLTDYLNSGGRVLLLQQGSGPLPAQRCPFWREAIKLFYPHPLWNSFPHQGYTDMQFFGLASDTAFSCQGAGESHPIQDSIPGITEIKPILRRLDAREYRISDYIIEATTGSESGIRGRLLACSLHLQGGIGSQPYGWKRNVAGSALLQSMLDYLTNSDIQPPGG